MGSFRTGSCLYGYPDFDHNSYYLMFCLREGGVGLQGGNAQFSLRIGD